MDYECNFSDNVSYNISNYDDGFNEDMIQYNVRQKPQFSRRFKMFFGLDWLTAFIKISFEIVFSIVSAIPAYFAWNCVAPIYLSFIPKIYQHIPYWHVVAIFLVVTYVGQLVNRIIPKLVNIENKTENKKVA